ncbi:potassium voltage-gated channel subfamily C member 1-like [Elgaria multicarinata webbii]|uniref:potassium voltage-gated channel subfamily C member 1-like n=1 Tax=Elgaria multicarinata webbii TaxID=159646 RepID=UPI002FCCD1F7
MEASTGKIILNVGGVRYETYSSTLRVFPGTKLCSLTDAQAATAFDYNPSTQEFFFDRSTRLFGQVLNYYRTRHLHCPAGICRSVFEEELAFWGITDTPLAPCCWTKLSQADGQQEDYDAQQDNPQGGLLSEAERRSSHWWARWQPQIWTLFEEPYSSLWAMCLMIISLLLNVANIIILCVRTKPESRFNMDTHYLLHHVLEAPSCYMAPYLLHLELFFILCLTVEFFVRLTFCPDKKKFLRNPLNVVDFLSLFPVFIELFSTGHTHKIQVFICWLGFFRAVYIVKLLKILKLVETPVMLRVLPYTFRSILKEIFIFMMIFAIEILFFGALCYYAELIQGDQDIYIQDIASAFWWAVITLTTVGYGDIIPFATFSRIIAACTAVCGVLTIIIPIPIFFIKFKGYYDAAVIKEKMKRMKKQMAILPS